MKTAMLQQESLIPPPPVPPHMNRRLKYAIVAGFAVLVIALVSWFAWYWLVGKSYQVTETNTITTAEQRLKQATESLPVNPTAQKLTTSDKQALLDSLSKGNTSAGKKK